MLDREIASRCQAVKDHIVAGDYDGGESHEAYLTPPPRTNTTDRHTTHPRKGTRPMSTKYAAVLACTTAQAHKAIAAAFLTAIQASPANAAKAAIDSLSTAFGPFITDVIALIKSGTNDLPAILATSSPRA